MFEDLKNSKKYDGADLYRIFSYAMYKPSIEKIKKRIEIYRKEKNIGFIGMIDDFTNRIIGIICWNTDQTNIEIINIGVDFTSRNNGIGRSLVNKLISIFSNESIVAETDSEAVEFYRKCGFRVESLGEKYKGIERFKCILD